MKTKILLTVVFSFFILHSSFAAAPAFEGRIRASVTRGGEAETFLYTIGTNCLRVERGETDRPYTVNLVHRDSGAVTLLFANNRSFVNLNSGGAHAPTRVPPDAPSAGVGSGALPTAPGAGALPMPSMPQMPQTMPGGMPAMPMMPMPGEKTELTATTATTNLLGYTCTRYELKARGEVMEIWATAALLPFPPYQANQRPRFGPRMIEEQWGGLVQEKKLFPLLATLKFENGPERLRYEVKSVTPGKLTDEEAKLFSPPDGYQEIQPLPF